MIPEAEARILLAEHKIERDILESRSCAEIAEALGIVPLHETVAISAVVANQARLQVENMTRNVRPEHPPYFVR